MYAKLRYNNLSATWLPFHPCLSSLDLLILQLFFEEEPATNMCKWFWWICFDWLLFFIIPQKRDTTRCFFILRWLFCGWRGSSRSKIQVYDVCLFYAWWGSTRSEIQVYDEIRSSYCIYWKMQGIRVRPLPFHEWKMLWEGFSKNERSRGMVDSVCCGAHAYFFTACVTFLDAKRL